MLTGQCAILLHTYRHRIQDGLRAAEVPTALALVEIATVTLSDVGPKRVTETKRRKLGARPTDS